MRHETRTAPSSWQTSQTMPAGVVQPPARIVAPLHATRVAEVHPAPICYVRLGRLMVFVALFAFWGVVILTFI